MKSRIFRPEFLNDERLYECGDHALVLYLGLMSMSDREGRLEDRPVRIKAVVLPYHEVDIDSLLTKLHDQEFITRYEENGIKCIEIKDFIEIQKPHPKENKSHLPCNSVKCREISWKEIKLRETQDTSISISKTKSKSIGISKKGECEGKTTNTPVDKSPTLERIARDELGHVLLSNDEFEKLEKKYPKLLEGITRLSDWIEAKKGQRAWFYKSYSSAFSYLNPVSCWVWREVDKKSNPPKGGFETKPEKSMRYLRESLERAQKRDTKIIDLSKAQHLNVDFVPLDEDDSPFFYGVL